jgi:hypothetical protein
MNYFFLLKHDINIENTHTPIMNVDRKQFAINQSIFYHAIRLSTLVHL